MLFLIPVIYLIRLGGVKVSGNSILWLFAGICVLFIGLLARVENEQSLRLVGHKLIACYQTMGILTLNALVLYAGLDLAARITLKIMSLIPSPTQELVGEGTPREKISYYASQDWATQNWNEFARSRTQLYRPYVLWRRAPFQGKTINVDQNGVRLTPGAECSANSFKVFTFGSSTMWGTGSPDWGTIPAYLQADLKKLRDGPICVMNFSESAYVSAQSIIALLLQLQSGNVPNWVLFYHGPDDISVAYESGRPDVHSNFVPMAARLEQREPKPGPFMELLRSSYLFSLSNSLVSRLSQQPQAPPKLITYESMGIETAALSESIAQRYLSNYKIVAALAQEYGFDYFFFWPPYVSIGDKPLTREERNIKREVDSAFDKLLHPVYQAIERVAPKYENLYYMGKIFDEYEPLIWIDDFHVTPTGNQMIAAKMLEIITATLRQKAVRKTKNSPRYSSQHPWHEAVQ